MSPETFPTNLENKNYKKLQMFDLSSDVLDELKEISVNPEVFLKDFNEYISECEKNGKEICVNPMSVLGILSFNFKETRKNKNLESVNKLAKIINTALFRNGFTKDQKFLPKEKRFDSNAGRFVEETQTPEPDDDKK